MTWAVIWSYGFRERPADRHRRGHRRLTRLGSCRRSRHAPAVLMAMTTGQTADRRGIQLNEITPCNLSLTDWPTASRKACTPACYLARSSHHLVSDGISMGHRYAPTRVAQSVVDLGRDRHPGGDGVAHPGDGVVPAFSLEDGPPCCWKQAAGPAGRGLLLTRILIVAPDRHRTLRS